MTADWPDDSVPPCPYEGRVPGPPHAQAPGAPYAPAQGPPKPLPAMADPPRDVPVLVRSSNLLGGFYNQFAWLWLGLTGVFLWVFVPNADVAGLWHFGGETATAPGVVTASRETNCMENDVRVYGHTFRFTGPDGVERTGESFATGRRLDPEQEVTVEVAPGAPSVARIRGMRRRPFGVEGWGGLLMVGMLAVFSVVGVVMLTVGVRKGLKANRMLRSGLLTLGRLKARRPTNTCINDRTVYEFTFEFVADDRRTHEAKAKTHDVDRLSDPRGEFLLYDPVDPSYAVLLDDIPGAVRVGEFGQLETERPAKAVRSFLLPALVLGAHSVAAWVVLG
ncbi:MAG: hypothetical protein ISS74_04515 [Planctomycetes bacterium]|nr:hypothetical protein [Planctomycetota bacterium]